MTRLEGAFASWVLAWRWPILVLSVVLVGAAASGGRMLEFTSNYRVFFSDENPQLLAFEAVEKTYSRSDNVLIVVTPSAGGSAFDAKVLAAVEDLTDRAWQIPYSTRVDSLKNFQHTEATGDDLVVRDLYDDALELAPAELDRVAAIAAAEPMLAGRLIAPDLAVTGVNVEVQLPRKNDAAENEEVVAFVRNLLDELRRAHPAVNLRATGMVMMNNAFQESSKRDMLTLVPLSFAVMMAALALLTRGFYGTLVTLVVIMMSILCAMGLGGWIGLPITPPSASAPTIVLTIAIANCVHVLITYLQSASAGMGQRAAMHESLRVNLAPVFLASLTTALGFLSMNFSEVPPFQHLGTFVAFGVGAAFVLSVTFLPALVVVLPGPVRRADATLVAANPGSVGPSDPAMTRLGDFVVRRRTALLWSMAALVCVLVASIPRNELNDVFVRYFDETVEFRRDTDYTVERLTGIYNIAYSLESGESGGLSEPAFLADVDRFASWYRAQPETKHVSVITDTLKRLNKNLHGDEPGAYHLPRARDLAAQYLLLYEMSLPYGLDLNNQINVDKSATRMIATLRTLSSREVLALESRAQAWLAANAPGIRAAEGTGTTVMFANIGQRNIRAMLIGTSVALIGISLVLVLALRSVKIGLISLIPNLIPGAMGFGVWALLVGEVGLSLSVVTSMTLGIVVDDTVHFLSKYLRARRERGYSSQDAVRHAFATVGRALLTTSVVLIAGFLVLSGSSFELNSGMGLLTAIVIALALLADFFFLPPLLMLFEERADENLDPAGAAADNVTA